MQCKAAIALGAQALLCLGVGMILLANDEIPKPKMYLEDCDRGAVRWGGRGVGGRGGGGGVMVRGGKLHQARPRSSASMSLDLKTW